MKNIILKNRTKLLFSNNFLLFFILASAVMSPFFLTSCASSAKSVSSAAAVPVLRQYVLEIEEKTEFIMPLYYSDIISLPPDTGRFITYDGEAGRYYVPGNALAPAAGGSALFEKILYCQS